MCKKGQKLINIVVLISFSVLLLFEEGYAAAPTVKLVVEPDKTDIYVGADPIAIATQASGLNLTYKWELLGPGKLEGTGPAVFYIVPEAIDRGSARAIITVTVSDGEGQETTETVIFNILARPPQEQPVTPEPPTKPKPPTPPQEQTPTVKPESKGISKTTKIILGGVATAAAIGGGVALLAGGGDGDGDGEPDPSLSGTWTGVLTVEGGVVVDVFFTLFQEGNNVTGYGRMGSLNIDSVTGTNVYPDVNLTLEASGFYPVYFVGRFSDKDTVFGFLSGSGFVNDPLTLRRQ